MLTPNKTPVKQRKIPDYIGIENLEKARVQMYRVFERLIIRKAFTYGQSYLNYALFRDYWNKTFGKNYGHLAPLQGAPGKNIYYFLQIDPKNPNAFVTLEQLFGLDFHSFNLLKNRIYRCQSVAQIQAGIQLRMHRAIEGFEGNIITLLGSKIKIPGLEDAFFSQYITILSDTDKTYRLNMAGLQLMARLSEPHKKLFMGVLDDFNFNSGWTRL